MAGSYIEHILSRDNRRKAASSYGRYVDVVSKKYDPFTRDMRRRMECDKINCKTGDFTEIHTKTPYIDKESVINQELTRIHPETYRVKQFSEPKPEKEAIRTNLELEAKVDIKSFFPWKQKRLRKEFVEQKLPIVYEAKIEEWKRRKDDFDATEARKKKEFEAQSELECDEKKAPLLLKLTRDEDKVAQALKEAVSLLTIPGDFGLEFFLDLANDSVYVDVDLPEITDLPSSKAEIRSSGVPLYRKKTLAESQKDYIRCICGIAFYIAGHFFNVNMNIKNVQVSGYTQRVNRSRGDFEDDYIYSVFFDKETFSQLFFSSLDPVKAIHDFPLRMAIDFTGGLSTIMPFPSPGDVDYVRGVKPQKEEFGTWQSSEPEKPANRPLYTPRPTGFVAMPESVTPVRQRPFGTYPVERVRFEGKEIIGEAFESTIRHRIPQYDFGFGTISERLKKNANCLKRDLESLNKLQQHFNSVLEAADKFEKEERFDKACYHYEQLLFEKYYDTKPIERLIEIYDQANLPDAKKAVLTEAISHFQKLRESRAQYLDILSVRAGRPGAAQYSIARGEIIYYYNYLFELYNPFTIIEKWKKELKRMNEAFIMRPYKQDINLPSHARSNKVDNVGTIRVKITRQEGLVYTMGPNGFELYLNIKPENKTYHATLETDAVLDEKHVEDIEIPNEAIVDLVDLTKDPRFMSLTNEDIFPDMMMSDGNNVTISVTTDDENLDLDSNMLEDTLWNGVIPIEGEEIETPFHLISAIAFEKLGIEPEEYEDDEFPET